MARLFRLLRANEIECRVANISDKGLSLLLYKDARVDMAILDETVGPFNWQRKHTRDNANCTIEIWDAQKGAWVAKEDIGTESNMEANKGLASDSFKRAGFNWGIGRELYSAPFIWVPASDCKIVQGRNGKPQCYDRFRVAKIDYTEDAIICELEIRNEARSKTVFRFRNGAEEPQETAQETAQEPNTRIDANKVRALKTALGEAGIRSATIYRLYKVKALKELTERQHLNIIEHLGEIKEAQDGDESATD